MAGIVGYRKTAWDNATNEQRAFLKSIMNTLNLGDPVLGTVGSEEWYMFSDWRINQKFVENLAWANSALPLITSEPDRDYPTVDGNGDPLGDPLTLAADAQGVVAWFTARQDLPAGWVPNEAP